MKSTLPVLAVAIGSTFLLSACGTSGFHSSSNSNKDQRSANVHDHVNQKHEKQAKAAIQFKGTVVYHRAHGGHYMISSDSGHAYHPENLPSSYRKAGLRVWVKGTVTGSAMQGHASTLRIHDIDPL